MRKHIAIDITSTQDQFAHRGVGNYTRELVSELVQNNNFAWDLIGFGTWEELRRNIPILHNLENDGSSKISFYSLGDLRASTPLNLWLWHRRFLPIIRRIKPELYFCPEMQRGLPIGYTKVAVMLHDVIPVVQNSYSAQAGVINYLKGLFYRYQLGKTKLADLVLTNSEFSMHEIKRVLGGLDSKPIYLGVKRYPVDDSVLSRFGLVKNEYFYCNSGFEQNKNLELLILSFAEFTKTDKEKRLIIVGSGVQKTATGEFIASSVRGEKVMHYLRSIIEDYPDLEGRVVFTGFLTDAELGGVMKNALALVNLSAYEGFGFSVAEALAMGVPVIAANSSCYPEIVQDAALLVELDHRHAAQAMQNIINNAKLRHELSVKGPKQVSRYSWKKCAEQTIQAFAEVI